MGRIGKRHELSIAKRLKHGPRVALDLRLGRLCAVAHAGNHAVLGRGPCCRCRLSGLLLGGHFCRQTLVQDFRIKFQTNALPETATHSDYSDFEFTDGDPKTLYLISRENETGKWHGVVLKSETNDGAFDIEHDMPHSLLDYLRELIPESRAKA